MIDFFRNLFNAKKEKCPRCLGKGMVTNEDITRLKKELYWGPGKCAYCKGSGTVSLRNLSTVNPETEYLTIDLPSSERTRLFNGDNSAILRSNNFKIEVEALVLRIEQLYYLDNLEPDQIHEVLVSENKLLDERPDDRDLNIDFIKKAINSKIKNK